MKHVRSILPRLLPDFHVIHLCGKGKVDPTLDSMAGYVQYDYIKGELKDLFALSDIVISRAGANAICELLALRKPALLIPLPAASSRGDQILNARSFENQGFSMVLEEEAITPDSLLTAVHSLYENRASLSEKMAGKPTGGFYRDHYRTYRGGCGALEKSLFLRKLIYKK